MKSVLDFCLNGRIGVGIGGRSIGSLDGYEITSRLRGFSPWGRQWGAPKAMEPNMTALEVHSSTKAKRATPPGSKANKSKPKTKQPKAAASPAGQPDKPTRSPKQDRILSLLNQHDGATIPEMMLATDWQQHSVRGFLAGTVKKKLGLVMTSSKSEGELRRYRIVPRRGR